MALLKTERGKFYAVLVLLLLPTVVGMLVFNYYPKFGTIKYSLYRWDGFTIEEFRGLQNFVTALTADPLFWQSFRLVGILLVTNLVKMIPGIVVAVAIHRLKSEKWQYWYRVLFVVPMVIPELVWLLIWKSFYDPAAGIFNVLLNRTGLMGVLQWLDVKAPALAEAVTPVREALVNPVFGSVWGLSLAGVTLWMLAPGLRSAARNWGWWVFALLLAWFLWGPVRAAVTLAVLLLGAEALRRTVQNPLAALRGTGSVLILLASLFILTSMIWTVPTKAFDAGSPAWLGHTKLVIPALVFWGFPWVGTIGVLIYLAGLQNISTDVYEAAELDGTGPIRMLLHIELPLIATAVRINLIFMTIGTLTGYGLFLVLLGHNGGPGNAGMVPGLYMYREAFYFGRFGYACALGMVIFAIVLAITILYHKYVKVEK
jgi:ABC-type sugar transport system permease subunit